MCGNWHKLVSILAWKSYRLVLIILTTNKYILKKMQSFSSNELLFLIKKFNIKRHIWSGVIIILLSHDTLCLSNPFFVPKLWFMTHFQWAINSVCSEWQRWLKCSNTVRLSQCLPSKFVIRMHATFGRRKNRFAFW